jgi:hypothetical protein
MDGPVYFNMQLLDYSPYYIENCPNQFIVGYDDTGAITGGESTFDGQGGPHGEEPFASAPASDPDTTNEFMKTQHVWQFNDPEGPTKIVWKKIIPIDGDTDSTDIEYTPYAKYIGEGEHPTIAHSGNNVVIIYMSGGNLICGYSTDDGDTFQTTTIGQGQYPDVCSLGSKFLCAYVSGGNLYLIDSTDGSSWSSPVKINDQDGSVVAEENCLDIHAAGVVWTDSRDGMNAIYYAPAGTAPSKPTKPDGPASGRLRTTHSYTTTSVDPGGKDLYYMWDWGDTIDDWDGPYPSGQEVTGSHRWTEEYVGNIKVKAKNTDDVESPWSDPLAISMPRDKARINSPLIQRLLELFPIFKNLMG